MIQLNSQRTPKKATIQQVVESLRSSPGFNDFVYVVREELASARERYETQPANEYTRGQLRGFSRILEILSTGT